MKNSRFLAPTVLLLALLAILSLAACSEDDTLETTPHLATIWPHADGSSWSYNLEYSVFTSTVSDTSLPSMETLHAALLSPALGPPTVSGSYMYDMAFDDSVTVVPGFKAQKIVTSVVATSPGGKRGIEDDPEPPYFIGGHAFAYEDSGYYGYGDNLPAHSWIYLEGELQAGQTFELDLGGIVVPSFGLRGRIWSVANRTIDGVAYDSVVECMYVFDMGIQSVTDEHGVQIGEGRIYVYGLTWFTPNKGPIGGLERRMGVRSGPATVAEPMEIEDYVLRLEEAILP